MKSIINKIYHSSHTKLLILLLFSTVVCQLVVVAQDSVRVNGFGALKLYKPNKTINNVVICISGDGGWNDGVKNMAMHLKTENTLIIGVDIRPVFKFMNSSKSTCLYPAADFERMSQFIQKKLGCETYNIPILMGYSSGATLAYGLLAQAPQNTFKGAIVMGFCPDFATNKPLCAGSGNFVSYKLKGKKGYNIGPVSNLSAPFISLQGTTDKICDYESTVAFLKSMPKTEVIALPNVGHGYAVEKNWLPQLQKAYTTFLVENNSSSAEKAELNKKNLPVHVTAAVGAEETKSMAFFISGDGGWTGYDQQIVNAFAHKGIPVVGLDALKYFWKKKTPQETTGDVLSLIEVYAAHWKKEKIILIGYSFGADIMPFVCNRLPENIKKNISSVGLLSPSKGTDFEIHVADLLSFGSSENEYAVTPEINKIEFPRLICFFGKDEDSPQASEISKRYAKIVYLDGGHHYSNGFETIYNELK